MKQYDTEKKESNVVMEGSNGKGVQMYKTPYLWRENNPAHPYADTPCENFVPMPTMDTGDDNKTKKAIKIGLLVAFIGFMVYALISIILESPELFSFGDIAMRQFY